MVEFLDGLAECSPGGFTGGEDGGENPFLLGLCLPALGGGEEEGGVGEGGLLIGVGGGGGGGYRVTLGGLYYWGRYFCLGGGCGGFTGAEVDGAVGGHFRFLSWLVVPPWWGEVEFDYRYYTPFPPNSKCYLC